MVRRDADRPQIEGKWKGERKQFYSKEINCRVIVEKERNC
jgi:hypothetical protein